MKALTFRTLIGTLLTNAMLATLPIANALAQSPVSGLPQAAASAPGWGGTGPSAAPASGAASTQAPAPQPTGLLDGLGLSNAAGGGMAGEPPADRKAVEGVPGLRWGGLTSCTMGRCSKTSKLAQGTVLLRSGEVLEGEFSCKIQQGKNDSAYHLSEVQFRNGRDDKKQNIRAESVWDFTVKFTIDDYTGGRQNSKDPAQSFTETVLQLADGRELRGLGALTGPGTGGFGLVMFALDRTTNVESYSASSVVSVMKPNVGEWIAYNGGLQSTRRGKNFLYFRNPRSTTRATGFRAGLANTGAALGGGIAATAVANAAAQQLQNDMQKRVDKGENVANVISDGRSRAEEIATWRDDTVRDSQRDLGLTKPEYVFRNLHSGYEVVFSEENIESQLAPILAACKTTSRMDKGQTKDLLKVKNLDRLFETMDACF